ncbi:response regulator [Paraglaciecola sp.]|uniref:response regulator n=1 Tax=Paraglaciecola sp. TaxID=1920173 RepID=UPI003EF633B7
MKQSILIVEDSEIDQYLAKYMIEKFNSELSVLQAYDGEEAINLLKSLSQQPKLILLDINMPRMNGLEFLDEYEASSIVKTNVVMLTSSFQNSDRNKCMAHSSVKKYLNKPLDVAEIESALSL